MPPPRITIRCATALLVVRNVGTPHSRGATTPVRLSSWIVPDSLPGRHVLRPSAWYMHRRSRYRPHRRHSGEPPGSISGGSRTPQKLGRVGRHLVAGIEVAEVAVGLHTSHEDDLPAVAAGDAEGRATGVIAAEAVLPKNSPAEPTVAAIAAIAPRKPRLETPLVPGAGAPMSTNGTVPPCRRKEGSKIPITGSSTLVRCAAPVHQGCRGSSSDFDDRWIYRAI